MISVSKPPNGLWAFLFGRSGESGSGRRASQANSRKQQKARLKAFVGQAEQSKQVEEEESLSQKISCHSSKTDEQHTASYSDRVLVLVSSQLLTCITHLLTLLFLWSYFFFNGKSNFSS